MYAFIFGFENVVVVVAGCVISREVFEEEKEHNDVKDEKGSTGFEKALVKVFNVKQNETPVFFFCLVMKISKA